MHNNVLTHKIRKFRQNHSFGNFDLQTKKMVLTAILHEPCQQALLQSLILPRNGLPTSTGLQNF